MSIIATARSGPAAGSLPAALSSEQGRGKAAMPVSGFMEPDEPAGRGRAMGAGLGILLIAVGSVLLFAVTASFLYVAGIILIVAGVLILLSALARAMLSSSWLRISWVSPGTMQGSEGAGSDYAPGNDQDDL